MTTRSRGSKRFTGALPNQRRRATDDQRLFLAGLFDEGILKAFRTYVEHPKAKTVRQLLLRLDDESWNAVLRECSQTAMEFAIRRRGPDRTGLDVSLSHNLAKAFVKTIRERSLKDQKSRRRADGPGPLRQLYLLLDEVGFQNYREGLLVLADRILRLYHEPAGQCSECRGCRRKQQMCPKCRRAMCPVHCPCAFEHEEVCQKAEGRRKWRTS